MAPGSVKAIARLEDMAESTSRRGQLVGTEDRLAEKQAIHRGHFLIWVVQPSLLTMYHPVSPERW